MNIVSLREVTEPLTSHRYCVVINSCGNWCSSLVRTPVCFLIAAKPPCSAPWLSDSANHSANKSASGDRPVQMVALTLAIIDSGLGESTQRECKQGKRGWVRVRGQPSKNKHMPTLWTTSVKSDSVRSVTTSASGSGSPPKFHPLVGQKKRMCRHWSSVIIPRRCVQKLEDYFS